MLTGKPVILQFLPGRFQGIFFFILLLPQYRPVEQDPNRPI